MPQRFTTHQSALLGLWLVWDKVLNNAVGTFDLNTSAIALAAKLNAAEGR